MSALTTSIEALKVRRTDILRSLDRISLSLLSQLLKYTCTAASSCIESYVRTLTSTGMIPLGNAHDVDVDRSVRELVGQASRMSRVVYKPCNIWSCGDREVDGQDFTSLLRTEMAQYLERPLGLCLRCLQCTGTAHGRDECQVSRESHVLETTHQDGGVE